MRAGVLLFRSRSGDSHLPELTIGAALKVLPHVILQHVEPVQTPLIETGLPLRANALPSPEAFRNPCINLRQLRLTILNGLFLIGHLIRSKIPEFTLRSTKYPVKRMLHKLD